MEDSLQRRYKTMDIFAQEETSNFVVIVFNAADALSGFVPSPFPAL